MPVLKIKKDGKWVSVVGGQGGQSAALPIPDPTEKDEGAFLKVVNGAPVWVYIPSAEEATF